LALAGRTKVSEVEGKREREIGGALPHPLIDYSLAATAINNVGKLRGEGGILSPPYPHQVDG